MAKVSSVKRRAKRNELHWIQNGVCFWCERPTPSDQATLDELIAQVRGGTSAWGNIVMACYPCNMARAASTPPKWAVNRARSMAHIRSAAYFAGQVLSGAVQLTATPPVTE
jgi:5-methylcytosine-specific restriction endonuclease McrA